MIIIVLGKMGVGKSTYVQKFLLDNPIFRRLKIDTTRPRREGEQLDEYNFITDEEFEKNEYVFVSRYKVASGEIYRYGFHYINDYGDYIVVGNPQMYKTYKQLFGKKVLGVYICLDDQELRKRLEHRGDDRREINRRLKQDERDFDSIVTDDEVIVIKGGLK